MASFAGNDVGDSGDQTVKSIMEFLKNYKGPDDVTKGHAIPVIVAHSVSNDFVNEIASEKINKIRTDKKMTEEEYEEYLERNWKDYEVTQSFAESDPREFTADFFAWLMLINKLNHTRSKKIKEEIAREIRGKEKMYFPTEKWIYKDGANQQHAVEFMLYKAKGGEENDRGLIVHFMNKFGKYGEIKEAIRAMDISRELQGFFRYGKTDRHGEEAELLSHLHGLLFGMEVMRSPLVLIINMMILDLLKWDETLELDEVFPNEDQREPEVFDSLMPCSMKGSAMAYREINDKFFSNKKWQFDDGDYTHRANDRNQKLAVSKTINKSHEVIIRWLKSLASRYSYFTELADRLEKVSDYIDDEPADKLKESHQSLLEWSKSKKAEAETCSQLADTLSSADSVAANEENIQNLTKILKQACRRWFLPIKGDSVAGLVEGVEKMSL